MPRSPLLVRDIKVDTQGLSRHLAVFSRVMKQTAAETVKEQAGLLCQDMLSYTLPIDGQPGMRRGEGNGARDVGIASMDRDIDRIFKPLEGASYADVGGANDYGIFAEYVAARRKAGMKLPKYVEKAFSSYGGEVMAWFKFRSAYGYGGGRRGGKAYFSTIHGDGMEEAHKQRRGGTNVDDYAKNVRRSKDVYFVADRDSKVRKYKGQMESHVGRMKAAWVEVGQSLGRKMRAGNWIMAHVGEGNAILQDSTSGTASPSVVIGNRIQGKMTKSPGRDLWKAAVNYRASAMRRRIYERLQRAARGSQSSVLEFARQLGLPAGDVE